MNAIPIKFAVDAPTFDELAVDADLDFTGSPSVTAPEPAASDAFEIVAVRPRRAPAGNGVVLVVDADVAAGERTAATLRAAGYHAALEHTPREAARHMSGLGLPALVLLEADLPQMDGFQFLEKVRGNRRVKQTPVVMYTARSERASLVRAFKAGADGFISKSVGGEHLIEALGKLLGS